MPPKHRSRSSWLPTGRRLLLLLAGAVAFFAIKLGVDMLPAAAAEPPYLGAWLRVWVFAALSLIVVAVLRIRDQELRLDAAALLLGICLAGIVLLGLKNTSFGLNGIGGDQGLQTAQVTKFAAYAGAVDFAYKELPPFYPPAYFLLLGKAAALSGIEPYRMLKVGLVAVAFVLPLLVRLSWAWLRPRALVLAALGSVVLYQDWYKPYEWLALVVFVPWWLYFINGAEEQKRGPSWLWFLGGSLIGAVLFSTYYYWFFIGALALVFSCFFGLDRERRTWLNRLTILGGSALFSLPFWGPLLLSMANTGEWTSLQNRYFIEEFNTLHLPFLEFSIPGLLLLGGLVYLLTTFQRNRLSLGLTGLVAAAYAWQLLGYVAFLAGVSLLTFKAREMVAYVLGLAALIGTIEWVSTYLRSSKGRQHTSALVAAAVIAALFFGQALAAGFADHELLPAARTAAYPRTLIDEYRAVAPDGGRGQVLLADGGTAPLSIYLPAHQFLSWAAVFSHPAGEYYARVEFLQLLSQTQDPAWFAAALMNNRYDHIDSVVLLPVEGGYTFGYLPENFPYPSETEHIFFPEALLTSAYLVDQGSVAQFTLFTPDYSANPLAALPDPASFDPAAQIAGIGDGDDFYAFLQIFGAHIDFPNKADYETLLAEHYGD